MAAEAAPFGAVLVTRPTGEAADALVATLRSEGFRVHHRPLLELHPLEALSPPAHAAVVDLDLYQHVIFISANAVRFGLERIDNYWPQLPVGLAWYAIGEATAALLSDRGIDARSPGEDMTSEGLLALPPLASVGDDRVLLVKGEGGRDTLRRELESRGARVDELSCYRRACPDLARGALAAELADEGIATVLLSSGEGLANFRRLLSPAEFSNFSYLCLVVPSARVARQAREAGFATVVTAANASDRAMLRALKNLDPAPETRQ